MPYNPRPHLLFGQTALCDPIVGADGVPRLAHDQPTLIDELALNWGRDNHWSQPEPSTLSFTFFDPGTEWPIKIATRNAIGVGVLLSIAVPPGHGIAEVQNSAYTIFQGFTTKVDAERARLLTTAGPRSGWIITVTAADRSSAFGNVPFSWDDWPAERMIDRAIRFRQRAAGTGIREIYFEDLRKDAPVRPTEVRDKTGLDVAHDLYGSTGHQWTYHPNRNVVNRIPHHVFVHEPWLHDQGDGTVFPTMPSIRDYTGQEAPIDKAPHIGIAIDGCTVESSNVLSTEQISDITRVEAEWVDRHSGITVIAVMNRLFAVAPFRTLTFKSWLSDGLDLDPTLERVSEKAFYEQSGPHHPPITYRTAPFGGFTDVRHAIWFLTPSERRGYAFLSGSPWIADMGGVAPIVTACGGRISYASGEWTVTTRLLRGRSTSGAVGLRWNQVDASLSWDGPTGRRFGPSVTWGDLWFVADPTIRYEEFMP